MSDYNSRNFQNSRLLLIIPVILGLVFLYAGNPQSLQTQSSEDQFVCPLDEGRIGSSYGKRVHPYTKEKVLHTGIDIIAKKGSDVYVSAAGIIIETGFNKSAGNYINVLHETNYSTFYSHLDKILVNNNQKVNQGDIIGKVGSTGLSTAPHLHFEIRLDGESINPEDIVDFTCLKK